MNKVTSTKLIYDGERIAITADDAIRKIATIFVRLGCSTLCATQTAEHLVDADLCGVESHGMMRTLQYADQFQTGYLRPDANPRVKDLEGGGYELDGDGGIGIPAMYLAVEHGAGAAKQNGMTILPVRNVGHTGRLGAFADMLAEQGLLSIMMGGGNRRTWRQVAPHGGRCARLPTNPYCIGIPGGDQGPVVLDFATSRIAGGWIYAARSAGAKLPPDSLIDKHGNPSQDPEDYFDGGAILPSGGPKGYALALMAELIAEAMLGPVTVEANWLLIIIDTSRYRAPTEMQRVAEDILADLRTCPPAPGFGTVEVPGERERNRRTGSGGTVDLPRPTWRQICALADHLPVLTA